MVYAGAGLEMDVTAWFAMNTPECCICVQGSKHNLDQVNAIADYLSHPLAALLSLFQQSWTQLTQLYLLPDLLALEPSSRTSLHFL